MTTFLRNRSISTAFYCRAVQLFICFLLLNPIYGRAADSLIGPEYEVKMGFIFNFINFVTWPDKSFNSPDEDLSFCFASDHPAANVLFQLNGQPVRGRKLLIRKVESEIGSEKCHILFFGTDNKVFIRQAIAAIRNQHILTIGEVAGFGRMGGIINFFNQNNKLRFEVNIEAAKRENLKLSAQLLQYAQRIVEETDADRKEQLAEIEKLSKKDLPEKEKEQTEKIEETIRTSPQNDTEDDIKTEKTESETEPERKGEE